MYKCFRRALIPVFRLRGLSTLSHLESGSLWDAKPRMLPRDARSSILCLNTKNNKSTTIILFAGYPAALFSRRIEDELSVKEVNFCTKVDEQLSENKIIRWSGCTDIENIIKDTNGNLNDSTIIEIDRRFHKISTPSLEEKAAEFEKRLSEIREEIYPLERQKLSAERSARFRSNLALTGGFIYLILQTAIMARLTWWEYSWDVIEPFGYFLTSITGILGYTFYLLTSRDFTYRSLEDTFLSKRISKVFKKSNFDRKRYETLSLMQTNILQELRSAKRTLNGKKDTLDFPRIQP